LRRLCRFDVRKGFAFPFSFLFSRRLRRRLAA
jgi:hypothetical protein